MENFKNDFIKLLKAIKTNKQTLMKAYQDIDEKDLHIVFKGQYLMLTEIIMMLESETYYNSTAKTYLEEGKN